MGRWPTWAQSQQRRLQAISLRRQGLSYKQIRDETGASMASLSLWLRDVPLSDHQRRRLLERRASNGLARGRANRQRRLTREAEIRRMAAAQIGEVSQRDLFIAGVIAYAAEGSKRKPWQSSCQVRFTNSDPRMILLYLRWLDLMGIDRPCLWFRVAIHEDADVAGAVRFWSEVTGVPVEDFMRTTLKKGNPKTRRRAVGPDYRGCLIVGVRRSGDLNKQLDGWFDAIAKNAGAISQFSISR